MVCKRRALRYNEGMMRTRSHAHREAFSLVELALVLTIIGLLVGGVLGGRALIRASKSQSVATDLTRIDGAVTQFSNRYNALPGDMLDAQNYWGIADAVANNCITTDSTGNSTTCNGDNDGMIETTSTGSAEIFRFWQHLANAGMVAGNYSGKQGPAGTTDAVIGTNVMRGSKLEDIGYSVEYVDNVGTSYFAGTYGNLLIAGGRNAGTATRTPKWTPAEALGIDEKLDDGKPGRGSIRAFTPTLHPNCATSSTESADYSTSQLSACAVIMAQGWK